MVALTIPLVLAVTFLFMRILGIDLHKISLGALIIALGLLVDDAIIAVEMMVRKMEEGMSRFDAATFAYTSTAIPMLTGTLITAAGFLPIGLAKSAAGEYTFSMFSVNALALLISWLAAVLFTPYIGYLLLKVKPAANADGHHELFDTPFYSRFRRTVTWCVEWRKTTIALTLVVFGLGVLGFRFIEQQFFPDSSRPELMVEMWMPEGTAFAATEAQANKFEAFLRQQPDIAERDQLCRHRQPALLPAAGPDFPADQRRPAGRGADEPGRPRDPAAQDRRCLQEGLPGSARPRQAAAQRSAGAVSGAVPRQRPGSDQGARAGRPGEGSHARAIRTR